MSSDSQRPSISKMWQLSVLMALDKASSRCPGQAGSNFHMLQIHAHHWHVIRQHLTDTAISANSETLFQNNHSLIIIPFLCLQLGKEEKRICDPQKRRFRPWALGMTSVGSCQAMRMKFVGPGEWRPTGIDPTSPASSRPLTKICPCWPG